MSILFALMLSTAAQTAPEGWTCDAAAFADGTCDCGCGALDEDCSSSSADVCERDNCPEGEVAWQDNNESCMAEGGCAAFPAPVAVAVFALLAARRGRRARMR